ncbi:MAG: LysM peptidoglycan-binding domain-containing protein [Flavobacteriales bacterium]|nr:LysM peptidoglycan-binding domain-containing protein [Flavobacteriales bacterium]
MRRVLLLLLVLPALLKAQEVVHVNGEKHLVHIVEAGQTLYAIARVHAVPVDALVTANPESREGLRVGQRLLVPMSAIVKKEARSAPTLLRDGELLHSVAKKETLFGIAKRYQVDLNDLIARNPSLTGGLKEGMEVIIRVSKIAGVNNDLLRPADSTPVIDHVVQLGETLFSLGQRYGVEPSEITALNGGLPEGLKAGMTIRVPQGGDASEPIERQVPLVPHQRYQVGLLLPFSIDRNDSTLAATGTAPNGPQFYGATRIAAQFYAGALMAIDSMKGLGLNADISVLDLGDDQRRWAAVLKDPAVSGIDLFIGPFHRSAVEQVARVNSHAHIVCPVPQSNKVILGHPHVSKTSPSRSDLVKHTARYVAMRHAADNILLVRPDIAGDKEIQDQMLITINDALAGRAGRFRDSVMVVKAGRRDIGDLIARLDKGRLNVIVAPSEDVEFTAALVTRLKPQAEKFRIALVGMESWLSMDPLAADDLSALGFLFASGSFADPTDPRIASFTRRFRERFRTDVDEYALLGFDVSFYYLSALLEHGPAFDAHFGEMRAQPLHMGFRMGRTGPENGFRNEHAIMLQHKDLQLVVAP